MHLRFCPVRTDYCVVLRWPSRNKLVQLTWASTCAVEMASLCLFLHRMLVHFPTRATHSHALQSLTTSWVTFHRSLYFASVSALCFRSVTPACFGMAFDSQSPTSFLSWVEVAHGVYLSGKCSDSDWHLKCSPFVYCHRVLFSKWIWIQYRRYLCSLGLGVGLLVEMRSKPHLWSCWSLRFSQGWLDTLSRQ